MPIALGTGRTGTGLAGWGRAGKADNRNSPIMLIRRGEPVKNWRATKGKAFHSSEIGGTSPFNGPS